METDAQKLQEYLQQDLINEKLRNAELIRLRRMAAISVTALAVLLIFIAGSGAFIIHTMQTAHTAQIEMALQVKKEICRLQAMRPEGALVIIGQHEGVADQE